MAERRALVVDDEPDIRELLELTLARMEIDTVAAVDLASARRALEQQRFDICLTDMRLPDGSGIELVRHIQQVLPDLPVAVITAHGSMETAIEALKAGAFDFVSKPIELPSLRALVDSALRLQPGAGPGGEGTDAGSVAARDPDETRAGDRDGRAPPTLVGESEALASVRSRIAKLARSQAPVYISGESGTGKELVARMIHAQGPRRAGPFVPVNCGAIPPELMESEFFGHLKGSFTGAVADKPGLFQSANGGTLFLDEVAELPLSMQVKLLRAIQEKAVRPVGARQEVPVDVRVLSATHKALDELVRQGTFRQDLYYRINVIEIRVPPLRERVEDVPLLARHILNRLVSEGAGPERPPRLTPAALERLCAYPFPGNVRELENILERALTLVEGDAIGPEDLGLPEDAGRPAPVAGAAALDETLEDVERARILEALEHTRWNRTAAARELGISFRALRYRLKKLGLD